MDPTRPDLAKFVIRFVRRCLRRPQQPWKSRRRLALECLEDRTLPSSLQLGGGGVLTYNAGLGRTNDLAISYDANGGTYQFADAADIIANAGGIVGGQGWGSGSVSFSAAGINSIVVDLRDQGDTLLVKSVIDPLTANMGSGNDRVFLGNNPGSAASSLDRISANVNVIGGLGNDWLVVNDRGDTNGNVYDITNAPTTRVARGGLVIEYSTVETLWVQTSNFDDEIHVQGATASDVTVNAGDGKDVIVLQASTALTTTVNAGNGDDTIWVLSAALGAAATTVNAGDGNDQVRVGNAANSLDDILSAVTVHGDAGRNDALYVYDQGEIFANSYVVAQDLVTRNDVPVIRYNNELKTTIERVELRAGNGPDIVNLTSQPLVSTNYYLYGGAGVGADKLTGSNQTNSFTIEGPDNGILNNAHFYSFERLVGYADANLVSNDTFIFNDGVAFAGKILGGTRDGVVGWWESFGNDWLDYSRYTTPVFVDLGTRSATGVFGGAIFGIANIHNVRGGAADDVLLGNGVANILVGNGGNDWLEGLAGRDLLIGGLGSDQLFGGDDDDILIAGTTIYDNDNTALKRIMDEWSRTDLLGTPLEQYQARVTNLRTGGNNALNGPYVLTNETVSDDAAADELTGGDGFDWFWLTLPGDAGDELNDQVLGELLNNS